MKELELLISAQEEQEKMGTLTDIGVSYLNGLRTAMKILKNSPDIKKLCVDCKSTLKDGFVYRCFDCYDYMYNPK